MLTCAVGTSLETKHRNLLLEIVHCAFNIVMSLVDNQ